MSIGAPRVVGLADPAALDVSLVGAKAAGLARARRAGLATLDGFVITLAASAAPLGAGAAELARRGSGAARLAVLRGELEPGLVAEIASAATGLAEPLIARSSSALEGDGTWAGAFPSLAELRREEVPKALRSVWSAMFTLEALERFEAAGIEPGSAGMGVLVQPELTPDCGGAATSDELGSVSVSAVVGSPRDLLAGWVPGVRAIVAPDGAITGAEAIELIGADVLVEVAALARRAAKRLDCNLIEWAVADAAAHGHEADRVVADGAGGGIGADRAAPGGVMARGAAADCAAADAAAIDEAEADGSALDGAPADGRVVLLQVQRSSAPVAGHDSMAIPAALAHPGARRLARLVMRYPGALGEELVLPWAAAPGFDPTAGGVGNPPAGRGTDRPAGHTADDQPAGDDNGELLARVRVLSAELTAAAWGRPADEATGLARSVLRRLRGDRPNESIEALEAPPAPDPRSAGEVLAIIERLGRAVGDPLGVWYHTAEELAERLADPAGTSARGRVGRDRWEPFLAGVAALGGEARTGIAASGGVGAGRLVWVSSPTSVDHVRPRDVIVVQYPLPNFAPLLWDAAGLIALGGAPSAHLLEVARSLTVPAVVGCPVDDLLETAGVRAGDGEPCLLATVDGDEGRVALLAL